ncbi:TetR/AcrR family transcriptional regulator [Kineosporia succinea]|uniref:AcrR family transcriptional regulator n=1 Tax=Kineosporia succinea TaxID=84632 RepID=A0ABT9PEE5_9ACTN|nr:TetR/AcrR family transcriptional regulator [Kineosporia succinea]MDP9831084.1 AcrR family transcriptional regulator [Kineosporia succinea]
MTDERYHHGNLRTALLEAARETMREEGAGALSLRDLARRVGVSHAAPRRHFPDRQALLDALVIDGFERAHAELEEADAAAGPGFAARLRAMVSAYVHVAIDDSALLDLMHSRKHDENSGAVAQAAQPSVALMLSVMEQGEAEGHLEPGSTERVGIALFATMHGIAAITRVGMLAPDQVDDVIDTAVAQVLR